MKGTEGEIARKRYFTIGVQLSDNDEYGVENYNSKLTMVLEQ